MSTDQSSNGNYRVEVTDFGPIAHADVDLRPLTVFAGPSNTGKSYLAMLVYALHRFFGSSQLPEFRSRPYPFWLIESMADSLPKSDTLAAQIAEWWLAGGRIEREAVPDDLADRLRPALEDVGTADRHLSQEVSRCFGVEALDDLVRRGTERTARVSVRVPSAGRESVHYRFEFGQARTRLVGHVPAFPLFVSQANKGGAGLANSLRDYRVVLRDVLGSVVRNLIAPLLRSAYYLPADRTGVMNSLQVVVGTLIQNATTAGVRFSPNVPMLSGVLADFLEDLIKIASRKRLRTQRLAQTLEKNLLPGTIRVRQSETGYPSFAYRPSGWAADLPMRRTLSLVSELAPIVLYLRHLVARGDLLIIEEPESHLHPAMQAVFARELARLVTSGVRVMLTTHSEWMLEALANLVRLADLPTNARTGITGSDVALTSDQVGAWMFTPTADGAGSTVKEIPLDTEAGSYPVGYGEITESLYNDWARIANRIEELRSAGT